MLKSGWCYCGLCRAKCIKKWMKTKNFNKHLEKEHGLIIGFERVK